MMVGRKCSQRKRKEKEKQKQSCFNALKNKSHASLFTKYRCTVVKVPAPKRGGGRQHYLHPLNLRAEVLISSRLSLTLEPSAPDYHLPSVFSP